MRWRELGKAGEPYPAWVRALQGKSGVYAIRVRGWFSPTIVYVGESHTGGLYKTLTRHFQVWTRQKRPPKTIFDWWSKARVYSEDQTDPGHTYERSSVEVAIRVTARDKAVALQDAWIRRLRPRDNVALAEEPVPF